MLGGLFLFWQSYSLLLNKRVFEAAPLTFMGFIVFRGGIHIMKVAVAAQAARNLPEALQPAARRVTRAPVRSMRVGLEALDDVEVSSDVREEVSRKVSERFASSVFAGVEDLRLRLRRTKGALLCVVAVGFSSFRKRVYGGQRRWWRREESGPEFFLGKLLGWGRAKGDQSKQNAQEWWFDPEDTEGHHIKPS